jgi:hypothetical protein
MTVKKMFIYAIAAVGAALVALILVVALIVASTVVGSNPQPQPARQAQPLAWPTWPGR